MQKRTTIILWILQGLMAALFLFHGYALLNPPAAMQDAFATMFAPFPSWFQAFIGIAELLAAVGLILPNLTKIATWLTPLATAGLIPIMIGAVNAHAADGEMPQAIFNVVIIAILAFIAWGRWQSTARIATA